MEVELEVEKKINVQKGATMTKLERTLNTMVLNKNLQSEEI